MTTTQTIVGKQRGLAMTQSVTTGLIGPADVSGRTAKGHSKVIPVTFITTVTDSLVLDSIFSRQVIFY